MASSIHKEGSFKKLVFFKQKNFIKNSFYCTVLNTLLLVFKTSQSRSVGMKTCEVLQPQYFFR